MFIVSGHTRVRVCTHMHVCVQVDRQWIMDEVAVLDPTVCNRGSSELRLKREAEGHRCFSFP